MFPPMSEQDWLDDGARDWYDKLITNLDPTLRHRASPAQTISNEHSLHTRNFDASITNPPQLPWHFYLTSVVILITRQNDEKCSRAHRSHQQVANSEKNGDYEETAGKALGQSNTTVICSTILSLGHNRCRVFPEP